MPGKQDSLWTRIEKATARSNGHKATGLPGHHAYMPEIPISGNNNGLKSSEKRPLEADAIYREAEQRGCKLANYLLEANSAPRTNFTAYSDLSAWGWKLSEHDNFEPRLRYLVLGIGDALTSIDASSDPQDNTIIEWHHARVTIHGNGVVYHPTGARYRFVMNPSHGLIVATSSSGPDYQIEGKRGQAADWPDGAPPPELKQWSDVVALNWFHEASPTQIKGLRHIIRLNVVNKETISTVESALKRDGVAQGIPPKWPGHTFSPLTRKGRGAETFHAVMATPNVLGIAWLLIQHKEQLGNLTIQAITVWDMGGSGNLGSAPKLCILVKVGKLE